MMTSDLAETLDAALRRLRAGESVTDITATSADQALVPLLEAAQMLRSLQPVETPTPEALRVDRDEFVMEIRRVQQQSVSPGRLMRLREWIAHSIPWTLSGNALQKKERRHITALIAKFALLFGLTFGSMGGAVALADESLPGSPLYSIKLASEEVTMNLTADPADRAALYLAQARERAQEMVRVTQAGGVPDETTMTRLQTRLHQSLSLASQLSDQDLSDWLVQAQQMTQAQEQALVQAQVLATGPAQEPLRQASTLLKQARERIEAGLQDPKSFRSQYTAGHQPELPAPPEPLPAPPEPLPAPPEPLPAPPEPLPEPPGPGEPAGNTDGTCTTGDCPPPGDQNQHGPGQPAGNTDGTCTTGDCPPPGDQNQHGTGEPAGNTDGTCTTGDCQPDGDQNQHGLQPGQPGPDVSGGGGRH